MLLGWHVGAIQQFLKSNQPEQRGSTRRSTPLSNAEVELGKVGMHFNESYVAVTGTDGGPKPFWGALRYTDIREPQVAQSKGQSSAGSSYGEASPDSPESKRGEPDGGGTIDGELGRGLSPFPDVVVEGGEGGDEMGVQQDADDMKDDMEVEE